MEREIPNAVDRAADAERRALPTPARSRHSGEGSESILAVLNNTERQRIRTRVDPEDDGESPT